jgi:hypothetical protein
MMPSYAQAVMTQYADFMYKGSLVQANENTTYARGGITPDGVPLAAIAGPLLWAGSPNVLCIVRQLDAVKGVFLVVLSVMRTSNAAGNLQMPIVEAAVFLPGAMLYV